MILKIVKGGWYKWERLRAKGRSSKYHELVHLCALTLEPWIGWTACGIRIPKPEHCKSIQGPVYGGEEKPCQNCLRVLAAGSEK